MKGTFLLVCALALAFSSVLSMPSDIKRVRRGEEVPANSDETIGETKDLEQVTEENTNSGETPTAILDYSAETSKTNKNSEARTEQKLKNIEENALTTEAEKRDQQDDDLTGDSTTSSVTVQDISGQSNLNNPVSSTEAGEPSITNSEERTEQRLTKITPALELNELIPETESTTSPKSEQASKTGQNRDEPATIEPSSEEVTIPSMKTSILITASPIATTVSSGKISKITPEVEKTTSPEQLSTETIESSTELDASILTNEYFVDNGENEPTTEAEKRDQQDKIDTPKQSTIVDTSSAESLPDDSTTSSVTLQVDSTTSTVTVQETSEQSNRKNPVSSTESTTVAQNGRIVNNNSVKVNQSSGFMMFIFSIMFSLSMKKYF